MVRVGFWYTGGRGLDSPVGHNFFWVKLDFAECLEKTLDKISFCRVPNGKHSAKQTDVTAVTHDEHVRRLCCVPAPRHLAYSYFAECLLFAEHRHSVNIDYGVCLWFAECRAPGTQQRGSVPSARVVALGKSSGTRHSADFR